MTLAPSRAYLPKRAVGGLDDYHCFLLEPHLAQDAFVTSALIKPQRPPIVHHVILFEASGQNAVDARRLNAASGGNGWTCFGGPGLSETHPTSDSASNDRLGAPPWISAWVPGHTTNDTPAGTGVLVHAGAAIVMQVHYNLMHKAQRDRSRAVIRFAPATTKLTPLNTILVPAPVELPCPARRALGAVLARRRSPAGDQEVRLRRRAHPVGAALPLRQVARRLPEQPGQREVTEHQLRPPRHPAAPDLRRRRPHAHARLRHQVAAERSRRCCTSRAGTSTGRTRTTSRIRSTRTSATRFASAARSTTRR